MVNSRIIITFVLLFLHNSIGGFFEKQRVERYLRIPIGSKLSITPKLHVPLIPKFFQGPHVIDSDFDLELPFTIHLDKLGLIGTGYSSFSKRYLKRKNRSIMTTYSTKAVVGASGHDDRYVIFKKLEQLFDSFGWNPGQHCILRLICEVHEFFLPDISSTLYNFSGFGLIGEMAVLLLSASKSANNSGALLRRYIEAEENGLLRNCSPYTQQCTKSIFTI